MKLSDVHGVPVSRAQLTVEGDMSHPGMSPVLAEAKELAPGRYQTQLDFAMAGDWVLLLHVKLADGQSVEREVEVRGVKPN